ncbi:hypothetical protein NVP1244A_063 [Vibrio phage 1.244.A._10N.261.54.C3]|nr:hypothetical protein NVP1244A_063 [Vibrio phage 1.244.A._10N.261.54.C3]AUR98691.1 hypothetical protein NVP1255O_063 [Vibrio phage 1.255.O._10N.286.45.F1]
MNLKDKSPVLDHAKKIRARYIEQQGVPADQHDKVMEPFLKDGDAILPLSSVVVIVTRHPSPTDSSDAIKVAVSANLMASPEGIAIEVGFVCREFQADLAEVYCMDPADGSLSNGSEEAWEMFNKLRRQEILGVINEMVEQRKAQEAAGERMDGSSELVDSNGLPLDGKQVDIILQQDVAEMKPQI